MNDATDKVERDTDPDVITTMILKALRDIKAELDHVKERLDRIDEKQGNLDDQLRFMVMDIRTIHELQRSAINRLGDLEKHWVDEPLEVERASVDIKIVDPTPFPMAAKKRKT